ncbi:MAG: tetratricopeptide repeat protein [Spirochaetes bacterium]|nr:tetratricopeptide repeat protein [Spirochaetota bacterium]
MKKTLLCTILLAVSVSVMPQEDKKDRMAVTSFNTLSEEADLGNLGISSSDIIEKSLIDLGRFTIRRKGEIQSYIDNLEKIQLGLKNADALKDMSGLLKVNYLIVGSVYKAGTNCEVDARAVNIDTWKIVHSSGINSFDSESAAGYIGKDIYYTFTMENLEQKEMEAKDASTLEVYKFRDETESSIKSGYGEFFAEMLNSEIGALRGLWARERTNSKTLIVEKALEMAGIIENNSSYEIFLKNNVGYMLRGDIRSYNDIICINYQVINTSNKKVVFMDHLEISSPKAFRPLARQMAKNIENSLNNKIGTLNLTTRPSGAAVLIDNDPAGSSPVLISLDKGKHNIRVQLDGYQTIISEIDIEPKKINYLNIPLSSVDKKLIFTAQNFERKKNYAAAVESYKEFIQKYGDTREADVAYYRMGHVLLVNLKKYNEALDTFQALVNKYPDTNIRAEAYYGMANCYREMDDELMAKEIVNYIIKRYPETFAAEMAKAGESDF